MMKFNIEQGTKKLFKATVADGGEEVDRRPGRMRAVFYNVPKITYNTYTFSPRQGKKHDQAMSKLKGKMRAFNLTITKSNSGTQLEWIIVSIIPVLSNKHRNFVYSNGKYTYMI